jgi:hypothetical protein
MSEKGLRQNLSDKQLFCSTGWTNLSPPKLWFDKNFFAPVWDKRRMISSVNDYTRVDDFYSKLVERNLYLMNVIANQPIDDIALLKLNKKCLELAEDVLEKIDWSRYISK